MLQSFDDPRGFLGRMPDGAVLDKVQRAPDILSYLQTHVDASSRMGLFLLTGSQHFGLMSGISQSLAGRTAFVELRLISAAPASCQFSQALGQVSEDLFL